TEEQKEDSGFEPTKRQFSKLALTSALGSSTLLDAMVQGEPGSNTKEKASLSGHERPPMKWGIKHSMQISGNVGNKELQLAKQLGMEYVNSWTKPARYKELVRRVEAVGLKMAKIGNGSIHNQAEIVLNLPGRDEKIEEFKQHLRALAAAGIKYYLYAHMANGIYNTEREKARGDAGARAFCVGKPTFSYGSSRTGVTFDKQYTEEKLWDNYEYFIKRIAPVAEETGVKIGIHPDDPPGLTLGNVPRCIFSSFEGYKRALEIADSPNVGIGLCCGCWLQGGAAMGRNVLETIEYFGGLKKLFIVHFRNVNAPLPHFYETYLNEGYMDMYKIMRALRKVNFDGVLIADHWPASVAGSEVSLAYTIGYIQALIERANEEFMV
ncbi:MAG: mannonate dehydratase, partial [Phycisphaerales bacterium]